jgi:hypothetical protein
MASKGGVFSHGVEIPGAPVMAAPYHVEEFGGHSGWAISRPGLPAEAPFFVC